MASQSAVPTIPQSPVDLPHPLLIGIRALLLEALLLSQSARNSREVEQANSLFLRSLASAYALSYRASFTVTVDHRGERSLDVVFTYDPELERF